MEKRLCCCLLLLLAIQILGWVSATSRPFAPNNGLAVVHYRPPPVIGQSPKSSPPAAMHTNLSSKGGLNLESKIGIGSTPPSCEHKCYGCTPCEAIQVPTTSKQHSHVGIQYANYEPEGWKCKCGPSFYTP